MEDFVINYGIENIYLCVYTTLFGNLLYTPPGGYTSAIDAIKPSLLKDLNGLCKKHGTHNVMSYIDSQIVLQFGRVRRYMYVETRWENR